MERILIVTGCAGFIGFNWLKYYLKNNKTIWGSIVSIDSFTYAAQYNIEEYLDLCKTHGIIHIEKDINLLSNKEYVEFSPKSWDAKYTVLNFASQSHVDRSIASPSQLYFDNIGIPASLIDWLGGTQKIEVFNHISTDEVYGDIKISEKDDKSKWFTTKSPFNPSNPYSASKVAQEAYLMSLSRTFGLNLQIYRMGNQFGKHQHPEKMLPISVLRSMASRPIKIYGEGKNCRLWTYVETTAKIISDRLENPVDKNPKHPQDILHIADKRFLVDNNYIVELIRLTLKQKYDITTSVEYVPDRKGHDEVYALITEPAIDQYFTNSLQGTIEEIVEFYVQGYKNATYDN